MTAAVTAMITAVVGVLGTLFAPVLSQRLTARQRTEEARLAERRRLFEERRAAYTAMNRSSRQFHELLKDALHRIRDGVYTELERDQLEEARRDYRDRYAEAQMVVPERILDASRSVNQVLADVDAAVKRLDRGLARDGESAEASLLQLKDAEPRLAAMRQLMRADLGVTE
jgi:ribosome-associated translation inhibitor RaiA